MFFLLKKQIPARGRKQLRFFFVFWTEELKKQIPARGRKPDGQVAIRDTAFSIKKTNPRKGTETITAELDTLACLNN